MNTKTLIIGARSNLSKQLQNNINNCELISTDHILNSEIYLESYLNYDEIKIIINSFYPSNKLNFFLEPLDYINKSIYALSHILNQIKTIPTLNKKIKKIIYTSSASVYGNNNYCSEKNILMPLNLQASLKLSAEKLIEGFCSEMKIDYSIARIFNMYGKNDNFSVVSKIINSIIENKTISLINNGTAIRDFVYIDDVIKCYKELLNKEDCNIINIASGVGISIKMILDSLEIKGFKIDIKNINKDEIKISTANIEKLNNIVDISKFKKVIEFIEISLKERVYR